MVVTDTAPQSLLDQVHSYLPDDKADLIQKAYYFAEECHRGQMRMSGEPYIAHPLEAANFLAELKLDADTIMAALLHDVIEDCEITYDEIKDSFGEPVAKLVDGVTKLTRMDYRLPGDTTSDQPDSDLLYAESLRKMLVAMAEDIRVVLIKLADRLHNMQTLDALPVEKRKRIAQETLDIYSPLAHRLGIWEIKWRLDDLAFRHLNETEYRSISKMLSTRRVEREAYVDRVCNRLITDLDSFELKAEVSGRPKGIYSIHQKINKYESQGKEISDIYDLYALRVLVNDKSDCYKALGIVHELWSPMPGQFDDYIANPKENMYQALHTTVICEDGKPLEVQIKTDEMHQFSEYGVAAHWRYKEGKAKDNIFEEKMTWLRQLLEWQRDATGTDEFIESVKQDIFHDQVFVYTPKGDIVELSSGSTPIDFAYKIHTQLGHRCVGGKVNGRLVGLDTVLQNGDTVEIMTTKTERGPSPDWLNPSLGYVNSASGRGKVRQWFKQQARDSNISRGKDILRREIRRMNLTLSDTEVLTLVKYDGMEDFLVALGSGVITEAQVAYRLAQSRQEQEREDPFPNKSKLAFSSPNTGVSVMGVGDLLTRMAECCNPIPGDEILGYITRTRGVSVHKNDCPNLKNEDEQERIIHVSWGSIKDLYPVRVRMEAYDRVGLLRDMTVKVSEEKVNIASVVTEENDDGTVTMELTLHTTGLGQLGKLFSKLEGVRGVTSVTRARSGSNN
ncbi:MAG: bifunctional (p)ppGpp synthetase/guanosine-3',5'-bis(diphosphate) 3'-pyrophosphohydrolase [SAR202 cluster bacterium]|nr:MAG: bifunctional (p)ppGpp synthetase/guanosine-3',5'-bis(diphosphate) 3'-pyrophosphohydrolase [SAR202 cluster bacterium]GIS81468.1 MAG: GTP pyrophosphokinase [Dehalococcoidia bacterium]|tara:strand:- start:255 stop:2450 length:2196 start_codon:yes stop_codon:yes gene_type:complete